MLRRTLCVGLISVLAACNSQTASAPPPTTSAPTAPVVSVADFGGDWKGTSQGGRDLFLTVKGSDVGFAVSSVPMQLQAPTFEGNTMVLKFANGRDQIKVSRRSATTLAWEYSGSQPSSSSTLTLVK